MLRMCGNLFRYLIPSSADFDPPTSWSALLKQSIFCAVCKKDGLHNVANNDALESKTKLPGVSRDLLLVIFIIAPILLFLLLYLITHFIIVFGAACILYNVAKHLTLGAPESNSARSVVDTIEVFFSTNSTSNRGAIFDNLLADSIYSMYQQVAHNIFLLIIFPLLSALDARFGFRKKINREMQSLIDQLVQKINADTKNLLEEKLCKFQSDLVQKLTEQNLNLRNNYEKDE